MRYVYLWVVLLASGPPQVDRRSCDHAAPPAGMHYVCAPADSCNCHLEADQTEDPQSENGSRVSDMSCVANDLKYFVAPTYPDQAWQAGKQGIVQAQILVGPSGTASVKIESGDPLLAQPAAETLKRWKFTPADPERVHAISIRFRLEGTPSTDRAVSVSGASPLELVITAHPPVRQLSFGSR